MTLQQFVDKYEGKKVDFDNQFGAQCVDLFRQYSKEVLAIPEHTGGVVGAKDLWVYFEKMPLMKKYFTKENKPIVGDIVIFNSNSTNKYGHVGIVSYCSEKTLLVFEQDGFKQDGAKFALWNYGRVLGFLRRK